MASPTARLAKDYPWVKGPVIASAPMRLIALSSLAVEVSKAGGIGFIGASSDVSTLEGYFKDARQLLRSHHLQTANNTLPIGIGFLNWGADLPLAIELLRKYRPAAAWFYAPYQISDLVAWTNETRQATGNATKIWIQIGTVAEAVEAVEKCAPDVLVVQGVDAGGHGLNRGAGIISLLPEVHDTLAAKLKGREAEMPVLIAGGGIADGRGVAASIALGAAGVVLGTRYLAAPESVITKGYRDEIIRASDGGPHTVRTSVYDTLRGTTEWPKRYGGRAVINRSYEDAMAGMGDDENKRLYKEEEKKGDMGWGPSGRMTTYAGTVVGLVTKTQSAKEITEEVREETIAVLKRMHTIATDGWMAMSRL
ncbi:inosine monophosphate dehydrogenase [Rhizodiscina lignyota]|uniref:Inosine monophosphate dehydrogenase n=1 Tax=Rhizodiscina lignyota TaxID=1504668 RepID=A0A9P4I8S3_9PEZI|nr:inosine monophosphate dehydrogenase [Rhizodiscina lignyota]